ncbi:MAG: collagen binding domain-containing protein [Thermomicrobiales bacterium]
MNQQMRGGHVRSLRIFSATVTLVTVLALLPLMGLGGSTARAAGSATITVKSFAEDGSTPLPFARFTVTDSNGKTYGPLEATPPDGTAKFTVDVDASTTFKIEEDTPPACGNTPDPQEVGPLDDGATKSVEFSTSFIENGCELGSISAYRYLCPAGTDLTADYQTLSSTCTATVDGVTIHFTEVGGQHQEWDAVTGDYGISGRAPLVGLNPGKYTVKEQVDNSIYSEPQGSPTVYCSQYTGNPAESSTPDATKKMKLKSGAVELTLNGERFACDMFTVPASDNPKQNTNGQDQTQGQGNDISGAATGTGSVEFHFAACPAGYPGNAYYDTCHTNPLDGIGVTADGPGGYNNSGSTDADGAVSFTDLPAGSITFHSDILGDNNKFFFYCSDGNGNEVPHTNEADLGRTISFGAGQSVICDWYVIPDEQGAAAPTGTGSIEIHLASCPAGFEGNGSDYYNTCHSNALEGINVTADGPGGYNDTETSVRATTPGPGVVSFTDLAAGDFTFHNDIPGDNNTFYIYCSHADSDETVPFTETNDLGFTLALDDGLNVICDWYVTPVKQQVESPNTITISKYTCPVSFDTGNHLDGFQANCVDIATDVTFTLTDLSNGGESRQKTGSDGKVKFQVGAGDFSVTEDVPGEFSSPVVFCAGQGEEFSRIESVNNGIPFTETSDEHDTCYWYNIPEDLSGGANSSVTIHKSLCPEGYTGNNYYDDCHANGLAGIGFTANGLGGYAKTGMTDNEGHLTFSNLDSGSYTFTEKAPTDFTLSLFAVYCSDADGNTVALTYTSGLGVKVNIGAGKEVTCDWYNVPEPTGPTGSIKVHAFLCSGQTDNKYNWSQDCTSYGAGAAFDLLTAAGAKVVNGTTNGDGIILFYSLSDGAWGLKETTGNWCHAEADQVDASGNVLVASGGNTDVFIYNCGKKAVTTLPGTGAGPLSGAPANAGLWSIIGGLAGITVLVFARRRPGFRRAA